MLRSGVIGRELGRGIVSSSYMYIGLRLVSIRQAWWAILEERRTGSKEMVQLGLVERRRRRGTEDLLAVERVVPNGSE